MNEQSLRESNNLLSALAARTAVGELLEFPPAIVADEAGIKTRLALARAVRALLSRGRLDRDGDNYRLVSSEPLGPEEPPKPRPREKRRRSGSASQPRMSEKSLTEANSLLAAIAARRKVGERLGFIPAMVSEEAHLDTSLAVARAVRALLSRGRLEKDGEDYCLFDARPLRPGEPPKRRRQAAQRRRGANPTHEDLGRLVIDRLIALNAECAELRDQLERSRSEAQAARGEASEAVRNLSAADRRVDALEAKNRTLQQKLSMTEANLKEVLDAAAADRKSADKSQEDRALMEILRAPGRQG